ncbi:MAG: 30S ribosomal protein S8 [Planctomycetota bacterium]|jgi:small subunit ribosomal protein S8|nr:30S ribosomal protein S8 [Planctomycetota bacterium]
MNKDSIADMLTRIRNGLQRRKASVDVPASNICRGILNVLKAEGYILGVDAIQDGRQGVLRVHLKYGPDGEQVLSHIRRESKPSRRFYRKADDTPPVLGGLGIAIYTTPQGILSDRQTRRLKVGGELLCTIW